jgi:undecaprenyl-diphosphatase
VKRVAWKTTALIAVFIAFTVTAAAAEKTFINRIFFEDFADMGRTIAENPVQSSIIAGSGILAGAIIYLNDAKIAPFMKQQNDINDFVFEAANYLGNGAYVFAADAFLFLGGNRERKAAQLVIETILVGGAFTQVIKGFTGRQRPSDAGPYMLRPFSAFDTSFPSGHACTAFAWATIIGDTYEIGWLTYPLAGLTAWARVYKNAHWPSDVLIGSLIGVVTAKILKASRDKEDENAALEIKYSGLNTTVFGVHYSF